MLIPRGNAIYRFFLSAIFPSPSPLFARQLISPTNRVSAKIPVERNNKRSSSNPREPWNVRLFQSCPFYVFQNMFRLLSKKRSRASVFFYIDGGKSRFAKLFNRLCNRSVRLEICLIGRKENVVLNRGEERFKFRFCFNRSRFDLGSIFFFFFPSLCPFLSLANGYLSFTKGNVPPVISHFPTTFPKVVRNVLLPFVRNISFSVHLPLQACPSISNRWK